jgi:hypothetical protein
VLDGVGGTDCLLLLLLLRAQPTQQVVRTAVVHGRRRLAGKLHLFGSAKSSSDKEEVKRSQGHRSRNHRATSHLRRRGKEGQAKHGRPGWRGNADVAVDLGGQAADRRQQVGHGLLWRTNQQKVSHMCVCVCVCACVCVCVCVVSTSRCLRLSRWCSSAAWADIWRWLSTNCATRSATASSGSIFTCRKRSCSRLEGKERERERERERVKSGYHTQKRAKRE